MLDTMKEFYQIKRNLIIAHNRIGLCHRLVVYKQAYDIGQEDLISPRPTPQPNTPLKSHFSEK